MDVHLGVEIAREEPRRGVELALDDGGWHAMIAHIEEAGIGGGARDIDGDRAALQKIAGETIGEIDHRDRACCGHGGAFILGFRAG